jgi:hypothetical protein
MVSCSDYEEYVNEDANHPNFSTHRITAEQAKQNALTFVGQFGVTTRTNGHALSIAEVKAISANEGFTRSMNDSVNLDTLFYVVNFDNNMGFVVAASDDRETPVFAYIEEGNYKEKDMHNNGFDAFMNALIEKESDNRVEQTLIVDEESIVGGGNSNYKPDKFEVMYPLLKTQWDQSTYNTYCPGPYTGCVVTAIAQICSFLKSPNHISWSYNGIGNQCYIDWDKIENECSINLGEPFSSALIDQIANLMRYWGVTFNAEYTSGGTDVNSDFAISQMRFLGYNATELTDYNATNVMNDLKKGNRIVYMRGNGRYYHVGFVFRKYVDGHGWVVDGYIHSIKNSKEALYMHCNWGWRGDCNGYFLSDVLNAEENPCFDDNANPTTRGKNFRYKLKTSTICK